MATKIYVSQIDTANSSGGQAPLNSIILVGSNGPYWSNTSIEDLLGIRLNEIVGYTGSVGYRGSAGTLGPTGFAGSVGDDGYQGAVGYAGSVGDVGPTGYLGSVGYQGSEGDQGPKGDVGFQGSVGDTGDQGLVGFTGSVGDRGPSGFVGSVGGPGTINFKELLDVPHDYTGANNNFIRVNGSANGIAFDSNTYLTNSISTPINFNNSTLLNPTFQNYSEMVYSSGNSGDSVTIDVRNGNISTVTLSNTIVVVTMSTDGLASGHLYSITLMLKQDAVGKRTVDWSNQVIYWPAGEAVYSPNGPTLSTQANYTDFVTLMTKDAGTTWYGMLSAKGFPTT